MTRSIASLILFFATFALAPLAALAAPITVPTGLNPGDLYRLAFVTSVRTNATSTNFHDYDAFATTVANSVPELQALGVPWYGVVSTPNALPARDNTGTNPIYYGAGAPIYTTGDTRIAIDNNDLWDGTIEHAIDYDEQGILRDGDEVWTGTLANGYADPGHELGSARPAEGDTFHAYTDQTWMIEGEIPATLYVPIYAMSGIITVPTPEPSALVLTCLAAFGLAVASLRRRRHCKR